MSSQFTMTKRSLPMIVVLSIVTFGIYYLVWFCSVQNQLQKKTKEGFTGVGHFFINLITFGIYGIYWYFIVTRRIEMAGGRNSGSRHGLIYLIGMIIVYLGNIVGAATDALTIGGTDDVSGVSAISFIGLVAGAIFLFWAMVGVQRDINDIGAAAPAQSAPAA